MTVRRGNTVRGYKDGESGAAMSVKSASGRTGSGGERDQSYITDSTSTHLVNTCVRSIVKF